MICLVWIINAFILISSGDNQSEMASLFFFPFLKLQLAFNIILASGVQHIQLITLPNLESDHCDRSYTHLTPYMVITKLLTVFPVLFFTSHDCFVTMNLHFSTPSLFSPSSPTPLPPGNHQSVLCICESVSVLFVSIVL